MLPFLPVVGRGSSAPLLVGAAPRCSCAATARAADGASPAAHSVAGCCVRRRGRRRRRDPRPLRLLRRPRSLRRVPVRAGRRSSSSRRGRARDGTLLVCLAGFLIVTPFFYSQSLLAGARGAAGAAADRRRAAAAAPVRRAGRGGARRLARRCSARRRGCCCRACRSRRCCSCSSRGSRRRCGGCPPTTRAQDRPVRPDGARARSASCRCPTRSRFASTSTAAPPPPAQRYWRGPVFSRFDGREWTGSGSGRGPAATRAPASRRSPTRSRSSRTTSRGCSRSTCPVAPAAARLRCRRGSSGARSVAMLTRDQQLLARAPVTQPLRYRQRSVLRDSLLGRRGSLARRGDGDEPAAAAAARPQPAHGRVRARAARSASRRRRLHRRGAAHWFRDEPFVYTLAPPLLERDPVDAFLFDTRRGFCEHYASAFVVLLRAAGIPARVVTGYQGGEINPRGGYMIVRQSDAHAWAEALIDGRWRRFDPTAAVAPSRIELGLGGALPAGEPVPLLARLDSDWLKTLQLAWDAINHDWRRNVVGFNHERQRSLWRDWKLDQPAAAGRSPAVVAAVGAGVARHCCWAGSPGGAAGATARACCGRRSAAGSRAPGCRAQPHEGPLAYADARGARAGREFARRVPASSANRTRSCATARCAARARRDRRRDAALSNGCARAHARCCRGRASCSAADADRRAQRDCATAARRGRGRARFSRARSLSSASAWICRTRSRVTPSSPASSSSVATSRPLRP